MLITGVRGVGKAVLLGAFEDRALNNGWVTVSTEITKNEPFGPRMGTMVRRALFQVAPKASWTDRIRRAAGVLKSFSVTVASDGSVTAGIDVDAIEGMADSGNLSDDLTDLLVALGEAAQDEKTGVAFLVDEVQFLRGNEFEALIAGLHRTVQRQLPITLVGAGLPQLPRLAGEAKSYAERLFKFPRIGKLSAPEAEAALTEPATERASATTRRHRRDRRVHGGLSVFLQEYGKIVWEHRSGREADLRTGRRRGATHGGAEARRIVLPSTRERTTELELHYLRDGRARPRRAKRRGCRRHDGAKFEQPRSNSSALDRQGPDLYDGARPWRITNPAVRSLPLRNYPLPPPR